jgi:WD40 repeat protein
MADLKMAPIMVKPTLGLDILSWSFEKYMVSTTSHDSKDGAKVILVEMHPIRSWILSCHKDGEIFLWDYSTNKLLMRKTLSDMCSTVGKEDSINAAQSSGARSSNILKPSMDENYVYNSYGRQAVNGVGEESARRVQMDRSKGVVQSSISELIAKQSKAISNNAARSRTPGGGMQNNPSGAASKRVKDVKQNFGEVRHIGFADRLGISHYSGVSINTDDDTFNSDSCVMISCDTFIIFYDFVLDTSVAIAAERSDLGKIPKCATFIHKDTCAVGFCDGQIRLWGLYSNSLTGPKSRQLKVLEGHQKEVVMLRVLQVPESRYSMQNVMYDIQSSALILSSPQLFLFFFSFSNLLLLLHFHLLPLLITLFLLLLFRFFPSLFLSTFHPLRVFSRFAYVFF